MSPMSEDLFIRLSTLLRTAPVFADAREIASLSQECSLSPRDAAALLLFCRLGYDMQQDREIYETFFHELPELLSPERFLQDPYLKYYPDGLHARSGNYELTWETSPAYELLPCDEHSTRRGVVYPHLGYFETAMHWPALCEYGQTWMTLNPHELATLRPMSSRLFGNTLIYGLGLGYIVFLALANSRVSGGTVIEKSPEVIQLFSRHLLPGMPGAERLQIIEDDAFHFAASASAARFDSVLCDLWLGVEDGLPLYSAMKKLEKSGPYYQYWIENTLRLYR